MKISKFFLTILLSISLTNCNSISQWWESTKETREEIAHKGLSFGLGVVSSPLVYASLNLLLNKPKITNNEKIAISSFAVFTGIINYLNIRNAKNNNFRNEKALYTVLGLSLGSSIIAAENAKISPTQINN